MVKTTAQDNLDTHTIRTRASRAIGKHARVIGALADLDTAYTLATDERSIDNLAALQRAEQSLSLLLDGSAVVQ